MTTITGEQERAFSEALKYRGLKVEDFEIVETASPVALRSQITEGWLTIRRKSNGRARTYSIGPEHDWVAWFSRDLEFGIYSD